ncbi:uncharacterized protein ChaoS9_175 [Halobacterium phage ChaoS9]|uniref:Uncharacterized protein n=1 Tax=Halobacterium phage ChaoS9 TaxID=2847105 RepID=A0A481V791_9CAUD|nr:uncharacterized protein KMC41_gp36 [Halobacterium phage ChaoS9]QBI90042.1 uncharacterized protein ChaoS9_175 [Halobacterium phage ChaoS9]
MIQAIFKPDDGTNRMVGHVSTEYTTDDESEILVETSIGELSEAFEDAPVEELPDIGHPVNLAIENPLTYRDYLILENGDVVYDENYSRPRDCDGC